MTAQIYTKEKDHQRNDSPFSHLRVTNSVNEARQM